VGNFKVTMSAGSFSMNNSLGNSLSVELGEFVDQVEVLKEDGSSGTSSLWELVAFNWHASASG
jgi:hypothetical protein